MKVDVTQKIPTYRSQDGFQKLIGSGDPNIPNSDLEMTLQDVILISLNNQLPIEEPQSPVQKLAIYKLSKKVCPEDTKVDLTQLELTDADAKLIIERVGIMMWPSIYGFVNDYFNKLMEE